MQFKLLLTLLFIGQLAFGQTEKHIRIPGTKCSLIPPEGFVLATSFSGLQNTEEGASIMIVELPAPYQTIAESFTTEALKTKGMTLLSKQVIDLHNSKATLIKVSQPANGMNYTKQILLFGDDKNTVLVNGIYPESSKNMEPKIKDALYSTSFNIAQNDNPLEAATFTINTDGTDFKAVRYLAGTVIFTTDGKIPTDKPTLIIGNSLGQVSIDNKKQFAEERLKILPRGEFITIKETNEIEIDNLKGFECVANGKDKDNNPVILYQVILFSENGDYFIILGESKDELEKYLQTFKMLAKTFKRK